MDGWMEVGEGEGLVLSHAAHSLPQYTHMHKRPRHQALMHRRDDKRQKRRCTTRDPEGPSARTRVGLCNASPPHSAVSCLYIGERPRAAVASMQHDRGYWGSSGRVGGGAEHGVSGISFTGGMLHTGLVHVSSGVNGSVNTAQRFVLCRLKTHCCTETRL